MPRASHGAFATERGSGLQRQRYAEDVFTCKDYLTVFHKPQGAVYESLADHPPLPSVSSGKHYVSLQIGHDRWILKIYVET